jgi:peptide/nickel transport system ATP-binding protein
MTLLNAAGVKAYYTTREGFVRAVDGVDITIDSGKVVGLVGESGCGKSTLGRVLMMNVYPPLRYIGGTILLEGVGDLAQLGAHAVRARVWGKIVSYVPQNALNALVPTRKVQTFVRDVLCYHLKIDGDKAIRLAVKRFEELSLPTETLNKYPHELSGGMRQRVTIAVATLLNPKLLIADEPTSALDVSTQKQVLKMFGRLMKEKMVEGITLITHDIASLRQIADTVAVMYAGKIVEISPMDVALVEPLHPYTKGLIKSVVTPEPEVKSRGLSYIPGDPPDLLCPPLGCRFQPRCNFAMDICSTNEPALILSGPGRLAACHLLSSERDHVRGA